MPKERFFITDDLTEGKLVQLEGVEFHHLATVMRAAVGQIVELINGQGCLAKAQIREIGKKRVELAVQELVHEEKHPYQLIIAQAIPKFNRLELIIEKGTELGMSALWLFPGSRSEKKEFSDNQLQRLNAIILAATKQCGRLYLPEIKLLPELKKWSVPAQPFFFGSLSPQAPLLSNELRLHPSSSIIFCVGPEGGLTEEEEILIEKMGGIGTKLHHHILRTETAAIAASAIISHFLSK